jgi:uncharacterized protein YgbK (DUF1537 family)
LISIIVGSITKTTREQIAYITRKLNDNRMFYEDVSLYNPSEVQFAWITSKEFIQELSKSNVLIMSGGETAYTLLYSSGFNYLLSLDQIMPLISTGVIKGGVFDDKNYIIKGGSIGGIDVYERLIEYARDKFHHGV